MKYLFTCVYETANKLMIFPDKVPLEVSEAVSLHDRGANITQHSRVMTDEQRKENTLPQTLPHLRMLSVQTMTDKKQTMLNFLCRNVQS